MGEVAFWPTMPTVVADGLARHASPANRLSVPSEHLPLSTDVFSVTMPRFLSTTLTAHLFQRVVLGLTTGTFFAHVRFR